MRLTTHRLGLVLLTLGAALTAAPAGLRAQARVALGGGVTAPTGDYGSKDKTGWHAFAAALAPLPIANLRVRVEGTYGQTPHQGFTSGYTKIGGGSASVVWLLRRQALVRPYVLTGLGYYDVTTTAPGTPSVSQRGVAWSGGAGLALLGVGPALGFLEARYMTIRTSGRGTNFFPITLGLVFGER
ncbi:MAG TPA: hypothetical protein VEU55_03280 [Gemmatimonadales bacterium]|nr:hypothetical protein [Gemmatimonadales bacterium]